MKRLFIRAGVALATFVIGSLMSAAWLRNAGREVEQGSSIAATVPVTRDDRGEELNRLGRLAAERDLRSGRFKIYSFIYSPDDDMDDIRKEIFWRDYGIEEIDIIWSGDMAEYARGYNQVSHPALLKRFGERFEVSVNDRALKIKLKREKRAR